MVKAGNPTKVKMVAVFPRRLGRLVPGLRLSLPCLPLLLLLVLLSFAWFSPECALAGTGKVCQPVFLFSRHARPHDLVAQGLRQALVRESSGSSAKIFELDMRQWTGNLPGLARLVRLKQPCALFTFGTSAAAFASKELSDIPHVVLISVEPLPFVAGRSRALAISMEEPLDRRIKLITSLVGKGEIGALASAHKAVCLERLGVKVATPGPGRPMPAALDELEALGIHSFLVMPDPGIYRRAQDLSYVILWGLRKRIAVMGLSRSMVEKGALCAIEPDYLEMGRQTFRLWRLLDSGKIPGGRVYAPDSFVTFINGRTAARLGIPLPRDLSGDTEVISP